MSPPTDQDAIPVALENDDVWTFRPAAWLQSIQIDWYDETKTNLLTDDDRNALRAIPWMREWMDHTHDAAVRKFIPGV